MWFPYWWNICRFLFFHNFLDVYVVQSRVLRLSKGLFRDTYWIKEFSFDPHIAYQSYKLTAQLHLTRKKISFFWENLKLIKKSYDKISKFQRLFSFPTQLPNLSKNAPTKFFIPPFLWRLSKFKILYDQFWNQTSRDLRWKTYQLWVILSNLHQNKKTWLSTQKSSIYHQLYTKNSINLMRRLAQMLLLLIFFLLLLISAIFLIFKQLLVIYFCDCFCVYFYLSGRFNSFKGKFLSDWIRQLEEKLMFLLLETTMCKSTQNGALFPIGHNFSIRIP